MQRFALAEIARMRAANSPAVGFAAGPVGRFTTNGVLGCKIDRVSPSQWEHQALDRAADKAWFIIMLPTPYQLSKA